MQANHLNGAVHVVLVSDERLAEVVGLSALLEDFSLEEAQRGVVPARTTTALVLHTRDRNLFHDCENRFVGTFLVLCLSAHCECSKQREHQNLFHVVC